MSTPIPRNEAEFSFAELLQATGGHGSGANRAVRGITTDSRAVAPGNLYVALAGERFDGHAFIRGAIENGAAAVLVDRQSHEVDSVDGFPGAGCIRVPDTLRALGDIARFHRDRCRAEVIGLTGSVGKTSTKELLRAALGAVSDGDVLATEGNLNNQIGVPMTLLGLDAHHHRYAVIEMGTNAPGEIARLAAIARPDVGLVTRIALAHSAGLGSLSAIAREKNSLLAAVRDSGLAIVNLDDECQRSFWPRSPDSPGARGMARIRTFGRSAKADVQSIGATLVDGPKTQCRFRIDGRPLEVKLRMLGEAANMNAAAVLAVISGLGLDVEKAAAAMAECEPVPGRLRAVRWSHGLLLDDTYNANPTSMRASLDVLAELARGATSGAVAVLGDMFELGTESATEHRALGVYVAEKGIGLFVAVGPEMKAAADAARARGTEIHHAPNTADAAEYLAKRVVDGNADVVLVKGSRSMAMERVVERVLGTEARS